MASCAACFANYTPLYNEEYDSSRFCTDTCAAVGPATVHPQKKCERCPVYGPLNSIRFRRSHRTTSFTCNTCAEKFGYTDGYFSCIWSHHGVTCIDCFLESELGEKPLDDGDVFAKVHFETNAGRVVGSVAATDVDKVFVRYGSSELTDEWIVLTRDIVERVECETSSTIDISENAQSTANLYSGTRVTGDAEERKGETVCNVVGSTDDKRYSSGYSGSRKYSSWIKFWEGETGLARQFCSVKGCRRKATCGAHVWERYKVKEQAIMACCANHNGVNKNDYDAGNTVHMELKKGAELVTIKTKRGVQDRVSGYTRKDGTKIKSYHRNLAVHIPKPNSNRKTKAGAEAAGKIFVKAHTRADGAKVRAHYREKSETKEYTPTQPVRRPSAKRSSVKTPSSTKPFATKPSATRPSATKPSAGASRPAKTVQVSGYTRQNGTKVPSYTRSAPSASRSSGSGSSGKTYVEGYTRANGTQVSAYHRSSGNSSSRSSSSSSYGSGTSSYSSSRSSRSSYGSGSSSYSSSSSGGGGGGTYVSGYTRSNGTAVSGYYRGGK